MNTFFWGTYMHIMRNFQSAARSCLLAAVVVGSASLAMEAQAESEPVKVELQESGLPPVWLQGTPVTKFEKDHLYIFEFWATWCGPCIAQMPHMEALYQEFKNDKNVSIIGVNVFDKTPTEKLKDFITRQKVTYPMAADGSRNGNTAKIWLKPLKVKGIPHALALRNGELLWRGNPAELDADLIRKMSDKSFSAKNLAAQKKIEEEKKRQEVKKYWELKRKIYSSSIEEAKQLHADYCGASGRTEQDKYSMTINLFDAIVRYGEPAMAQSILAEMSEEYSESIPVQIGISRNILTYDDLEEKDLQLVIKCLERAIELGSKNASLCYQSIADAKLMLGDQEGAILASEKAVEISRYAVRLRELKQKKSNEK